VSIEDGEEMSEKRKQGISTKADIKYVEHKMHIHISPQITFLLFWLITELCMKFLFLSWTEHAKRQKYVP